MTSGKGSPAHPPLLTQLAREGRLTPEKVQELICVGKLDKRTVAQLRAVRTYPEKYLRPYSGVKRVVIRTTKNKTISKTVGWLRYTF